MHSSENTVLGYTLKNTAPKSPETLLKVWVLSIIINYTIIGSYLGMRIYTNMTDL